MALVKNDLENGKLYLKLEYELKDIVKANGGRWDPHLQVWYVTKYTTKEQITNIMNAYTDIFESYGKLHKQKDGFQVTVRKYYRDPDYDSKLTREEMKQLFSTYTKEEVIDMFDYEPSVSSFSYSKQPTKITKPVVKQKLTKADFFG